MICNKVENCKEEQLVNQKTTACVNKSIECIEVSDNRSRIKCEERKKKYILENTRRNHVILYKMDGGIIPQDKSVPPGICKCDYLFVLAGQEREAILTELKGVDVAHSLKQLDGTLSQFKALFSTFNHVYGRVVVTSSTPNIKASPNYVNLVKKLRNNYRGNLKIAEKQLVEKDIDLVK